MPRARTIKPGFFTNDRLGELPPLTRLLFAGLWTLADREGRLLDRPKKIKVEILPYDAFNVDKGLQELAERDFLQRYVVEDTAYIQVNNWFAHQHPHPREEASSMPDPRGMHGSCTSDASVLDESTMSNLIPAGPSGTSSSSSSGTLSSGTLVGSRPKNGVDPDQRMTFPTGVQP